MIPNGQQIQYVNGGRERDVNTKSKTHSQVPLQPYSQNELPNAHNHESDHTFSHTLLRNSRESKKSATFANNRKNTEPDLTDSSMVKSSKVSHPRPIREFNRAEEKGAPIQIFIQNNQTKDQIFYDANSLFYNSVER